MIVMVAVAKLVGVIAAGYVGITWADKHISMSDDESK